MPRQAITQAAAAILAVHPGPASFPTVGLIRSIAVIRVASETDTTTPGQITDIAIRVSIPDRADTISVKWSGAFAAEVELAIQDGQAASAFVGRSVKVELIDGQMIAAYTVNGNSNFTS